jgi:hypothetical protein
VVSVGVMATRNYIHRGAWRLDIQVRSCNDFATRVVEVNVSIGHFAIAFVCALVVSQASDWLFTGVLFHDRYLANPEVWRHTDDRSAETRAIVIAGVMTAVSVLALEYLVVRLGFSTYHGVLKLALAVWVIGVLPTIVTYIAFIKLHPVNSAMNALSWIVKLSATAMITLFFLRLG